MWDESALIGGANRYYRRQYELYFGWESITYFLLAILVIIGAACYVLVTCQ